VSSYRLLERSYTSETSSLPTHSPIAYFNMRFTLNSLLFLASLTLALPLDETPTTIDHIPTVKEAAVQARKLLKSESIATLSTVFPEDEPHGLAGQPIGLMDYYADCSTTGNPTLLAMGIATS
jgi:hypothetical protein